MKKRLSAFFVVVFILGDLGLWNISIFFSYRISSLQFKEEEVANAVYFFIFSNLAWLFLLLITNPYKTSGSAKFLMQIKNIFSFLFVQLLVLISLILFFNKTYSSSQMTIAYIMFVSTVIVWRIVFQYVIKFVVKGALTNVNYVIVGSGELADKIRKEFRLHPEYGYRFLGSFEETKIRADAKPIGELQDFSKRMGVNEIYCCWPETSPSDLKEILDFALNAFVKVKIVTDAGEFYQAGLPLERFDQIPVFNISAIPLDELRNQIGKKIFDVCFTILVMVSVLIWLLPLIAILIKMNSKGPVFFKQLRAGKSNKPFECLKFRTMYLERDAEFVQATKEDPRITAIGKFLRKTSLDEFPQFINVLNGDMSIVGPRPHPMKLNDDFADRIRKLMSRHYVKPGITGLAQCMGYRGETRNLTEMKNRVTLDRFYVENWSLSFDLWIIFKTVISLIRGSEKAY